MLTMRKVQQALVAFGANLQLNGQNLPITLISAAKALLSEDLIISRMSRIYTTPCFPAGSGPDYVNAAAVIETSLDALGLLARLHQIEADFGRDRVVRWGKRTLDLDLLAMGDQVAPNAVTQDHWRNLDASHQRTSAPTDLILPHPRMQDRAFVLVPLAEVAPEWRHPRLGLTVLEMLNRLETADIAEVTPL
jgi:2-amino-4-hydroxy-6-hydroxymethyldihydropteridine diphosphokinase